MCNENDILFIDFRILIERFGTNMRVLGVNIHVHV